MRIAIVTNLPFNATERLTYLASSRAPPIQDSYITNLYRNQGLEYVLLARKDEQNLNQSGLSYLYFDTTDNRDNFIDTCSKAPTSSPDSLGLFKPLLPTHIAKPLPFPLVIYPADNIRPSRIPHPPLQSNTHTPDISLFSLVPRLNTLETSVAMQLQLAKTKITQLTARYGHLEQALQTQTLQLSEASATAKSALAVATLAASELDLLRQDLKSRHTDLTSKLDILLARIPFPPPLTHVPPTAFPQSPSHQ